MKDIMEDIWVTGSRCDICEKPNEANESEIKNHTSAISEEEIEEQVPLLLLCDPCREELDVFHLVKKLKRYDSGSRCTEQRS
jgi:hypothetical protein